MLDCRYPRPVNEVFMNQAMLRILPAVAALVFTVPSVRAADAGKGFRTIGVQPTFQTSVGRLQVWEVGDEGTDAVEFQVLGKSSEGCLERGRAECRFADL